MTPTVPRPSASLLLLLPHQEGYTAPEGQGNDYSVLLVKRRPRGSFFGAHVFPGGNLDKADSNESLWSSLYTAQELADPLFPLRICALRETFEECGLLLVEPSPSSSSVLAQDPEKPWRSIQLAQREEWRKKVHGNGATFVELFAALDPAGGIRPAIGALTHWSNWITPRAISQRYDTHFFIAFCPPPVALDPSSSAPPAPLPHTLADGVENDAYEWLSPTVARNRGTVATFMRPQDGYILLHPPQYYQVGELSFLHKSYRSLLPPGQEGRARVAPRGRKVPPMEPEINHVDVPAAHLAPDESTERSATVLPLDSYHSSSAAASDSLVNRTYVHLPSDEPDGGPPDPQWALKPPPGLKSRGSIRQGVAAVLGWGWEDFWAGDCGKGLVKEEIETDPKKLRRASRL